MGNWVSIESDAIPGCEEDPKGNPLLGKLVPPLPAFNAVPVEDEGGGKGVEPSRSSFLPLAPPRFIKPIIFE